MKTERFRRSAGTLCFSGVGTHRICLLHCKQIPVNPRRFCKGSYTCCATHHHENAEDIADMKTDKYVGCYAPLAYSEAAPFSIPPCRSFWAAGGKPDYPIVTSTVTFAPLGAMGRTLPVMGLPSTVTEATPFWTALGFLTVMS